MAQYDLTSLSPHDFETLCQDLLRRELNLRLDNYKPGKDGGVDLLGLWENDKCLIVQCKHYITSGYSALKGILQREEILKVKRLNPSHYLLITSVPLSLAQKAELLVILKPYAKTVFDIFGAEDINAMLRMYPEVERRHIKLWLTSIVPLQEIIHAATLNETEILVEDLREKARLFAVNESFDRARQLLEAHKCCIISGIPGIGKTTLAGMLLLDYLQDGYEPIKVSADAGDAIALLKRANKVVILYDDFLGQTGLDYFNKNEDQRLASLITAVQRAKNARLIMTTREYILRQAISLYDVLRNTSMEVLKYTLDMGQYAPKLRALILYNHLYFSALPREYRNVVLDSGVYRKIANEERFIPRIVEQMTNPAVINELDIKPEGYARAFILAIRKPERLWQTAFNRHFSEEARHLLLLLASMPGSSKVDCARTAFYSFMQIRTAKYNSITLSPDSFKKAMSEMDGSCVRTGCEPDGIRVKFSNPSIRDFVIMLLVQNPDNITDLINGAIYFEQCLRLYGSKYPLDDAGEPSVLAEYRQAVRLHFNLLLAALERTFDSEQVSLFSKKSLAARALFVIEVAVEIGNEEARSVALRLLEKLEIGIMKFRGEKREAFILLTKVWKIKWYPENRKHILDNAVKSYLMANVRDADDYSILADYAEWSGDTLEDDEWIDIVGSFSEYSANIANCPQEYIESSTEADAIIDKMRGTASIFGVDVTREIGTLQEYNAELSSHEDEEVDRDDYRSNSSAAMHIDNFDIDALFGSLREVDLV